MTALIPYSEPPIPRVALEIERLRQRLDAAEEHLKEQKSAPVPGQAGAPVGRLLTAISAAATVALVVIAGSLVWQQTHVVPPSEPRIVVQAPPLTVQTPQLSDQTLPTPVQTPQSLTHVPPATGQSAQSSVQTPPAPGPSAKSSRQSPPARAQSAQSSRQTSPARSQSAQLSQRKPPAPVHSAQSSDPASIPALYYRPSIVLPPPMHYGYWW